MKKKNGFIAISVVYSFFLVFLMLLLFLANNSVNNRIMLNTVKEKVKIDISDKNFARYLVNHKDEIGLVSHDESLTLGAMDNSLRYAGNGSKNFVCLSNSCNNNDLYQIIGVIDNRVKLVKYTSVITSSFDDNRTNVFVNTKMYSYLNQSFLSSLGSFGNMIDSVNWFVGGVGYDKLNKPVYEVNNYELGANMNREVYINAKIGLPYISDYAYASEASSYNVSVGNNGNWMFQGSMWLLSRVSSNYEMVYSVDGSGNLSADSVSSLKGIRPAFYLKSNVRFLSGDGTKSNPYKVG